MSSSSPGDSSREENNSINNNCTDTSTATLVGTISTSSVSTRTKSTPQQVCKYFVSKGFCSYGEKCRFKHPLPPRKQVCQHYLASRCRYGNQCKFLHVKKEDKETPPHSPSPPPSPTQPHLLDVTSFPSLSSSTRPPPSRATTTPTLFTTPTPLTTPPNNDTHLAHKKRGHERRAEEPLTLEDFIKRASNIKTRPAVARPKPSQVTSRPKLEGEGPRLALRDIEIEQLKKRYPSNQLIEKSSEIIVYSISVSPTDPDWVHYKLPSIEIKVSLPLDYPRQSCTLLVTSGLPTECIELINEAVKERIKEHYEKSTSSGQYDLMLRPILNWLDNQSMSLIKGTSFFEEHKSKLEQDTTQEDTSEEEEEEGEGEEEDEKGHQSSISSLKGYKPPAKRGTEIRLVDMQLSDSVGTVQVTGIKMTLECVRCKSHCDLMCKGNKTSSQVCIRCNQILSLTLNLDLLHSSNSSLAYLDLSNCKPVDLVLSSCEGLLTCVECGREHPFKGWSFGQALIMSCHSCHTSLSVGATQCRFVTHQPGKVIVPTPDQSMLMKKKKKQSDIIEGRPLPDTGTCQHYKKSHRWLRFPCCGKAFPCDVCHDSTEDHPMERANRMICGYCAKEQVYNGIKPCSGCGSDMTQSRTSSHWEGGQGCRNKVKMGRNDRQKYLNSEVKTVSMKSERVGVKGKNNIQKNI